MEHVFYESEIVSYCDLTIERLSYQLEFGSYESPFNPNLRRVLAKLVFTLTLSQQQKVSLSNVLHSASMLWQFLKQKQKQKFVW